MSVYKLKDLAKRGAAFALAVGFLSGIAFWALPGLSFADALNPLTERTLLLSSSSPGFHYKDAAGNTEYAPPGSGPNGKQTGETFSFRVSTNSSATGINATDTPLKAFTLQYCTTAAGICNAPGNNSGPLTDDVEESDLDVHYGAPDEVDVKPTPPTTGTPVVAANDDDGNFGVYWNGALSSGWTMTATNKESLTAADPTGDNNFITLTNGTSTLKPAAGDKIELIFYATDNNYITNPGDGAFFVKINDYDSDGSTVPADIDPEDEDARIVDGGVTVANVMTDSIQISTKVLETMAFSVGTTNPDLLDPTDTGGPTAVHGPCDAIDINNPLKLGISDTEFSLKVDETYDTHSYWRLSSNSSGGATVYYSGYSLSNTVGDVIDSIGDSAANGTASNQGAEQFGLAFDAEDDHASLDTTNSTDATNTPGDNTLDLLLANAKYANGDGAINGTTGPFASFSFSNNSLSVPQVLATESDDVVTCATGKMRYIANVAAATPAGIYTSAINYLAAPQY